MVERKVLDAAVARLTPAPGTYALELHLSQPATLQVGALGLWQFPVGFYIYVGSAWGPGGLAARVGRHLRGAGKQHWHIDILRPYASPTAIWATRQTHCECAWAALLLQSPGARVIVPRFGASDCKCVAHLIYWSAEAASSPLLSAASIQIELREQSI